ncbi:MAG TPA: hypothetical protein VMA09_19825 [Candidatus Binataceae bacterium]|nr:hypothetical protein [Candidatus Binataceae bacterium]
MSARKKAGRQLGLISKIRKPTAPPTRVAEDERKYSRKREAERMRRQPPNNSDG